MKYIIGKKIEMTQIFNEDGKVIPVTAISAGPCVITQIRQEDKDGYTAVQIGYGNKNKIKKSLKGHFKDLGNFAKLKEFRVEASDLENISVGQKITIDTFEKGDKVKVIGVSRGFGFQGVVKRHGFHGQDKTHGNKDQLRMPGSIGATGPARVFKGTRMGGHMGSDQVTLKNVEIIDIDLEKNILYVKGGLPGSRNTFIFVSAEGVLKTIDRVEKVSEKKAVSEEKVSSVDISDEAKKESPKNEEKQEDAPKVEEKEVKTEDKKVEKTEKAKKEVKKEESKEEK